MSTHDPAMNKNSPASRVRPRGPVEAQVRADVAALVSAHPMGEALAALAYRLAALCDDPDLQRMAVAAISRELRETLLELARLKVGDDDDLEAELSRPDVPAEVRDTPDA